LHELSLWLLQLTAPFLVPQRQCTGVPTLPCEGTADAATAALYERLNMRSAVILAVTVFAFFASTTVAHAQNPGRGQGQNPGRGHQKNHEDNRRANRVLSVPEPATLVLVGAGVGSLLAGTAWRLRRRSNRK
jgi:hypothetical protein